jgi:hypothetical protein
MTCSKGYGCSSQPQGCPDQYGCIPGVCPDFTIRRHDTKPAFKVKMEDCDGPIDLTDLVLEATMWAKGKIKKTIAAEDTYFSLANNIGFNQIMIGDMIYMDRTRSPEYMLVTGFDEDDYLVHVQRGYRSTTPQSWKKGTPLRIVKFSNAQAQTEMIYQDIIELDGTTTQNVLVDSFFIYEWAPGDTCLPGCYYLEFKLIKMVDSLPPEPVPSGIIFTPSVIVHTPSEIVIPDIPVIPSVIEIGGISVIPSFTSPSLTPSNFGCGVGIGDPIEWIRRFPVDAEGFLIRITDSPTQEG